MLRTVVNRREVRVGSLLLRKLELEKQDFPIGKRSDSWNSPKSRTKCKNGWDREWGRSSEGTERGQRGDSGLVARENFA